MQFIKFLKLSKYVINDNTFSNLRAQYKSLTRTRNKNLLELTQNKSTIFLKIHYKPENNK